MNENTKIGLIGLGERGMELLSELLPMSDVKVTAVCDLYDDRIKKAVKMIKKKDSEPFTSKSYIDVIVNDRVDVVLITASRHLRAKIACEAMQHGKFTALDSCGAYDINDCAELVKAHEESGAQLMFLENCCYGERELMCLNMAKQGVFGSIVQCCGAYAHDLREEIAGANERQRDRLECYLNHNRDNSPTHALGPIAKMLGINRGNRMVRLISVPSLSMGMREYAQTVKPGNEELASAEFKQSDIVNTTIVCENGEIIRLMFETTLPRFYSRGLTVMGTKGMFQEDGDVVFIDGEKNRVLWMDAEFNPKLLYGNAKKYAKLYGSSLWGDKSQALKSSRPTDYLALRSMVYAFVTKTHPAIDVYDAAAWMSITALSEKSIQNDSAWVEIPDFTNGKYKTAENESTGKYSLG